MKVVVGLAAVLLAIVAAGCSTSDWLVGSKAEEAKDYAAARDAYRRDLEDARKGNITQHVDTSQYRIMRDTYDLGRMTGYTCDYAEAERLLREALRLGEQMDESISHITATLSELARLSFDQGKFQDSVAYYERAVNRLDRFRFERQDPIGLAKYLEDYSSALEQAGNAERAAQVRGRAASIRSGNPGRTTKFNPVYYRDVCGRR